MNEQVELALVVEELKAQRNVISDQLAYAGALIVTLRKKIEELEKPKEEPKE